MGHRRTPSYWWDFHLSGNNIDAIHVESDADYLPDPIRVFPVYRGACDHLIATAVEPFIADLVAGRADPRRANTDIVAVLRQQAVEIADAGHNGWGNTMQMARDEIERLRAALSMTREGVPADEEL